MSININFPFNTSGDYTPDAGLEITGGKVQSKLQDNPGQEFVEDFADDTGFTYDPTKAEFVGGKVQQKDQRPAGATFGTTFTTDINGNWGGGVLIGTAYGGAGVSGGELDLTGGTKYVAYAGLGNADSLQVGCVYLEIEPPYSGNPSTSRAIFTITKEAESPLNMISMYHSSAGSVNLIINDFAGTAIIPEVNLGAWAPVAGTKYKMELNWDLTTGATRFFINGVQFGATQTQTGTRSGVVGAFFIGARHLTAIHRADAYFDNVLVFQTVQHIADYTPGYTVPETVYAETSVILPEMEWTGPGTLISFDDFQTVESGIPKYTLQIGRSGNYLYWNGTAWVTSDGTPAQANIAADFLAHIGTLAVLGEIYGQFKIIFADGNTISDVDTLTATLTAQSYPTTEQKVYPNTIFRTDQLDSYVQTASSNTRIIFRKNSIDYYWNGTAWAVSALTWAQSNTAAQLTPVVLNAFPGLSADVKPVWLLKSDGTTQEYISDVTISYSFAGPAPTLETCTIWDYHYNMDGTPKADALISANLLDTAELPTQGATLGVLKQEVYTAADGYWEVTVAYDPTDERPQFIRFLINGIESKKVMQFQASLKFSEMVDVGGDL